MPVYEYSALDIKGKTVSGVMDAESAPAVRQKLRTLKIFPVSIKEVQNVAVISMTVLLGPVMILIMGVIVGLIVLSICLPIFEMNQLIR